MDLERIGAFLGIAAFLGLAILILLVIQQARDLRRLRKWAGVAPERAIEAAERKGEEVPEPEHGRLARPFIALGAWIHDRATRAGAGVRSGYRAADRRSPVDLRFVLGFLAVAAVAGIVLLTSGFGLYGEEDGKERKGKSAPPPGKIEVAVLNGTAASGEGAVPGFAQQIAQEVKQAGYKIGRVGDTDTSFVETVVMYEPGMKASARGLAGDLDGTLGRTSTQAIIPEVRGLAGKADLALVLGQDDARSEGAAPAPEAPAPAPEAVAPETAPVETAPTG
ncbi:MAG TPA: LytR C-terminal domain-containing protein [Solirubrobacterales bacterium]